MKRCRTPPIFGNMEYTGSNGNTWRARQNMEIVRICKEQNMMEIGYIWEIWIYYVKWISLVIMDRDG